MVEHGLIRIEWQYNTCGHWNVWVYRDGELIDYNTASSEREAEERAHGFQQAYGGEVGRIADHRNPYC